MNDCWAVQSECPGALALLLSELMCSHPSPCFPGFTNDDYSRWWERSEQEKYSKAADYIITRLLGGDELSQYKSYLEAYRLWWSGMAADTGDIEEWTKRKDGVPEILRKFFAGMFVLDCDWLIFAVDTENIQDLPEYSGFDKDDFLRDYSAPLLLSIMFSGKPNTDKNVWISAFSHADECPPVDYVDKLQERGIGDDDKFWTDVLAKNPAPLQLAAEFLDKSALDLLQMVSSPYKHRNRVDLAVKALEAVEDGHSDDDQENRENLRRGLLTTVIPLLCPKLPGAASSVEVAARLVLRLDKKVTKTRDSYMKCLPGEILGNVEFWEHVLSDEMIKRGGFDCKQRCKLILEIIPEEVLLDEDNALRLSSLSDKIFERLMTIPSQASWARSDEFLLQAVNKNHSVFQHIPKEYRSSKKQVKKFMDVNPNVYEFLSPGMRGDVDFAVAAIRHNRSNLAMTPLHIDTHPRIRALALDGNV